MIEEVEKSVTTGRPLFISRRYNTRINPLTLREAGYCRTEKKGNKIHYVWQDQFPVPVIWEGSKEVIVVEPGDVLHKQNASKGEKA